MTDPVIASISRLLRRRRQVSQAVIPVIVASTRFSLPGLQILIQGNQPEEVES